jgi:hypothetical protein
MQVGKYLIISLAVLLSLSCSQQPVPSSQLTADAQEKSQSTALMKVHGQELFLSGINTAWNHFARDFGFNGSDGGYDENYFDKAFKAIAEAGGNSVRWWVHTSGEFNPKHDDQGYYSCKERGFLGDLSKGLTLAKKYQLNVILVLWSFDMLDKNKGSILDRNRKLLTSDDYLDKYIKDCLEPMLDEIKGNKGLFAIEVFNEPEGMTWLKDWSITEKVAISDIQRFTGKVAAKVHEKAPGVKVTVGAVGLEFIKYYADSELIRESGEENGTLDFYQAHYYDSGVNPFTTEASKTASDKPLVMGEFASNKSNLKELFQDLYRLGYAGALTWKFKQTSGDNMGSWENGLAAKALSCLASKHPDKVISTERLGAKPDFRAKMKTACGESDGEKPKDGPSMKECKSSLSDPDGDGFGVENGARCKVKQTTFPDCQDSSSDPDGDGWGWENNKSCRVVKTSDYPYCHDRSSDPDGDGWGWENNKSCRVR